MKGLRDLESILALDVLTAFLNSKTMAISQLNAAVTMLIRGNIPFTLTFSQRTRSNEALATLAIDINPHTSISFTFEFEDNVCI